MLLAQMDLLSNLKLTQYVCASCTISMNFAVFLLYFSSRRTKGNEVAPIAHSKPMNRYNDILPNPATQVQLDMQGNDPASTYINANYIRSYSGRREHECPTGYIATQGPLPSTLDAFMRMIWEQNMVVLVQTTGFIEKEVVKCERYFPEEAGGRMTVGSSGQWTVDCTSVDHRGGYYYSELVLHNNKTTEQRDIVHFWFNTWPDHGVPTKESTLEIYPDTTIDMLQEVRKTRTKMDANYAPLLVHCSAGVGRTGTFIVIDQVITALEQGHSRIDIVELIDRIREDRMALVQHTIQYEFAYNACLFFATRLFNTKGSSIRNKVFSGGARTSDGDEILPIDEVVLQPDYDDFTKQHEVAFSPLYTALTNNASVEIVKELIAAWPGAVKELCEPNCFPLHIALKHKSAVGIVDALIDVWPTVVKNLHDSKIQPSDATVDNIFEVALKEGQPTSVVWHKPPLFGKLLAPVHVNSDGQMLPRTLFRVEITKGNSKVTAGTVLPEVDARHLRAEESCTMLRFALMHGASLDVLKALSKVDPDAIESQDMIGDTLVHNAVKAKRPLLAQYLTDTRPNAVYIRNSAQDTPLNCALKTLPDAGGNEAQTDSSDTSALNFQTIRILRSAELKLASLASLYESFQAAEEPLQGDGRKLSHDLLQFKVRVETFVAKVGKTTLEKATWMGSSDALFRSDIRGQQQQRKRSHSWPKSALLVLEAEKAQGEEYSERATRRHSWPAAADGQVLTTLAVSQLEQLVDGHQTDDDAALSEHLSPIKEILSIGFQMELQFATESLHASCDFIAYSDLYLAPIIQVIKNGLDALKDRVIAEPDRYRELLSALKTNDKAIYDATHKKSIERRGGGDPVGYAKMLERCKALQDECVFAGVDRQPVKHLIPLVLMTRERIPAYKAVITRILAEAKDSCPSIVFEVKPIYRLGDQTKSPYRMFEKALTKGPDRDYPDCSNIFDVFGCIIECVDYTMMTAVVDAFAEQHKNGAIQMVRVKDRCTKPTEGGWRDFMLNIVIDGVVFEVQVVHQAMRTVRSTLKAHAAYDQFRCFSEVFALLGLSVVATDGSEMLDYTDGHVYDAMTDSDQNPFESLPTTWRCPCGAAKSAYSKGTVDNKWQCMECSTICISADLPPIQRPAAKGGKRKRRKTAKFVAPAIRLGTGVQAAVGLPQLMGVDDATIGGYQQHPMASIEREFMQNGTEIDKKNFETVMDGTYRNPPDADGKLDKTPPKTIGELMLSPDVQTAGLKKHHVVALRLYTTKSYESINKPMRKDPPTKPNPFAATTFFISEAIKKLRAVDAHKPDRNEPMVYWRGLDGMSLSQRFVKEGGTEFGCMSTSTSKDVAIEFSEGEHPLVFKFVTDNFMSRGADISFLSVYPEEKETLYPPLTYLQVDHIGVEVHNYERVLVASVKPVIS